MTDLDRLRECIFYLKKNKIIQNQRDISVKTGYGYTTISEYLNEKTPLSEKFIKNFANNFGFNSEWILTGTGKMINNYNKPNEKSLVSEPLLTNEYKLETLMESKMLQKMIDHIIKESEEKTEIIRILSSKLPDIERLNEEKKVS